MIPEELQLRILTYVPQKELAATVSLVCRHWHVLANDTSLWPSLPWKLVFSSRQDKIALGTFLDIIIKLFPMLSIIILLCFLIKQTGA
jgi:hypothetical protein